MNWTWKKRIFTVMAILLFPITAFATAPEATTELVLDLWYAPKCERHIRKMKDAHTQMDVECKLVADRIRVKETLIMELMEGRRTLKDVSARFMHMNKASYAQPVYIILQFPHAHEDEIAARNVIGFAESRYRYYPGQEEEIKARLKAQFEEMFPESVGL